MAILKSPTCSYCCPESTSSIYRNSWFNNLSEGQGGIKDESWWLQWLDGWKRLCFYWPNCLHLLKKWVFSWRAIEMDKLKCVKILFILPALYSLSLLLLLNCSLSFSHSSKSSPLECLSEIILYFLHTVIPSFKYHHILL